MQAAVTPFPVVGIGASAGGVDALRGLFGGMPDRPGLALVVLTHLSPDRESVLHEIIGRHTAMPVQVAEDGMAVEPNHVYVLPSNAALGFSDGCLRLYSARLVRRERKPIDLFLSALAKDRREFSGAVILSGCDSDGTLGVKAVKEAGGLTMAQVADGHPPQHPDMPESAISTGMIDFAIPVEEMGERLAEFARSFAILDSMAAEAEQLEGGEADEARREIYVLLRTQMGHDFSGYKTKTFLRRVHRRMQVSQLNTIAGFVELLRRDPKEVSALFRDLLINVTNFFRDADAFEALAEQVIPRLFEGRGADETVRVWVPGCATGEEVFSIAILMREHMEGLRNVPRVQLFATDIDDQALNVARSARYPEALLDSVSEERRRRFFVRDGASYMVAKEVRDLCIFSPHSVLRDPPFSRIDLVSCRNLLIYLGVEAQNQVIPTFRYALKPGGYLFLGTSESVTQFDELFVPLDKKQRLFRARDDGGTRPRLPLAMPGIRSVLTQMPVGPRPRPLAVTPLRQAVEAFVLERHVPPHVVVSADGDIVFYGPRTGKYFEAPAGAPNRQILALARKGLRLDLRSTFREAVETGQRVACKGVEFENSDGRIQQLSLSVEPLATAPEDRLFLVTFQDNGPALSAQEASLRSPGQEETSFELERELRETRERLQSTIEEYETALEELKSSNEELVSVNEELQSTNEEMEASKEELQALNEELHTVNTELNSKVEALDSANSDLQNLFEVTDVAVIFLDADLVIRMFTPAATQVFKILPSDRGRPLTDLSSRLVYPEMIGDLRRVVESEHPIERQVADPDGDKHYLARITPYRDVVGDASGLAVTVLDVTGLARAEAHQRVLVAELNHRVKNMLAVVLSIAGQMKRETVSLEQFYADLAGRIGAMTRAYELLSAENWSPVSFADVAAREAEPFGRERLNLVSDAVLLSPRQALSMALVLHELFTNAIKHGALSAMGGSVELRGRVTGAGTGDGGRIEIDWREHGGPPVEPPAHEGFGMRLVRNETGYNLRGEADVRFLPEGLRVGLRFPRTMGEAG